MPLAFPDPSSPPSSPRENGDEDDKNKDEETPTPPPKKSFLSILLTPITFLLRPVLADEHARREGEKTWQYWLGQGAGLSAIVVFALGHFVGRAKHVRMLAISSSSAGSANAVRSGGWRGGGAGRGGGTLRVVPALGGATTVPVSSTVLVSPLLVGTGKAMSTVTIQDRSGAQWGRRWGWGVHMFKDGAVVNGQWVAREDVIGLMERIWVHRGGEIRVRDGR
ncbi:hypothetical protein GALMADRAFT_1083012 [Galerina marginata CBS 339.88]|uniref:Uncharacterized protein n=1 Tax=Galerina marginata (strain CBS 339.88) TaxID=685588 RepID=A0A067SIQ1_GALM3|nr:hypothetical protein GALMADRAFT_1083012 [Galerina marginata CBS 339.88]